ncbi:hypothetical protein CEXT_73371 [Caerostris extrusa]|uniref:Uncharacterized protein n=1 Tax=Caerostris extrusa TaxID=172846 RepID=A0AAV4XLL5_CAEEX|nr:hypothetical protein CEXT_73371 [Caerostris extrusa]
MSVFKVDGIFQFSDKLFLPTIHFSVLKCGAFKNKTFFLGCSKWIRHPCSRCTQTSKCRPIPPCKWAARLNMRTSSVSVTSIARLGACTLLHTPVWGYAIAPLGVYLGRVYARFSVPFLIMNTFFFCMFVNEKWRSDTFLGRSE